MRRLELNLAQRIVLVIALAGALDIVGFYIVTRDDPVGGGWFGYAPGTGAVLRRGGLGPAGSALVWLLMGLLWTVGALLIFATPRQRHHD